MVQDRIMELETRRLILRPPQREDVPVLAGLWTDPDVTRYMGGPRDSTEVYDELMKDTQVEPPPVFNLWVVVEKSTGKTIGHCGIVDKEIEGVIEYDLTYVFEKSAWGKGYAAEMAGAIKNNALENLGLTRIIALIDPANTASIKVATKIGLKWEKDVARPGGKTMQVYALNKSS